MEDNVSKIKDRLDVVDVISGYLKLQKMGANFKARCPFHNEKTPSFVVSPERQVWHCFGCSKGGDIFTFVQEIESADFPEALKILAAKANIELEHFEGTAKDSKTKLFEVCETAVKFFEKQFSSSAGKRALGYLKERGVSDATIKEFRLGFAPNDWSSLGDFLRNCGYSEDEMLESGLVAKRNDGSGVYDRFRSRITFPIFDLNGQVVGFTGRIFSVDGQKTDPEVAKYINTPQTAIYDKSRILYGLNKAKTEIKKNDQCVLVEGNMDALMSYQAGVRNVVASSGTALTPNHLRLLQRFTTNLGFCFDTDQAGAMATKRGIGLALSQKFNVKVVEIDDKECKDPADLIKKSSEKWSAAVSGAKPILEFYFNKVKAQFDPNSVDSKKFIILTLAPFIKRLESQVEKTHWITQLAFFLRAKEDAIEADINSAKDDLDIYEREPTVSKIPIKNGEVKSNLVVSDVLNETFLSLVMKNPELFKEELKTLNQDFLDPYTAEIVAKLATINRDNIGEPLKEFREKEQSYKLEFAYLRSQELWKDFKDEDLKLEFSMVVDKIRQRNINAQLTGMEFDIKEAEAIKDKGKIKDLMLKFSNLTKELLKIQNGKKT